MASRRVSNPASALGEAIGKIVEDAVAELIEKQFAQKYGFTLQRNIKLRNGLGVQYDIDLVLMRNNEPVALIEVKFLRYKKHMRDKGSWVANTFLTLRRTYPTITYTLAILLGDWTKGAKEMLQNRNVDIIEIPFDIVSQVFRKHGIEIVWEEKDRETPARSWEEFQRLALEERNQIGKELISRYEKEIITRLEEYLIKKPQVETIEEILLIAKTNLGREVQFRCTDITECEKILNELKYIKTGEKKIFDIIKTQKRKSIFDFIS